MTTEILKNQERFVGVFRENEGNGYIYSFREITENEYNALITNDILSTECSLEAAFCVSENPFEGAEKVKWSKAEKIIYADRVVINKAIATDVIYDVVADMIVEDAIAKEVDTLRIKIEKNSLVAKSMQELNFREVKKAQHFIYFEVDFVEANDFENEDFNDSTDVLNKIERIEVDIRPFLPLFGINQSEKEIEKILKKQFDNQFIHWNIELPENDLQNRKSGFIKKSGWTIQYCFGKENDMEYLDYYATHRMTNDRHIRIYQNGEEKELPALLEGYLSDTPEPEPQKTELLKKYGKEAFQKHNSEVKKLLLEKGFDKFSINMILQTLKQ